MATLYIRSKDQVVFSNYLLNPAPQHSCKSGGLGFCALSSDGTLSFRRGRVTLPLRWRAITGNHEVDTGWHTKCHTIDCARNKFYYYKN